VGTRVTGYDLNKYQLGANISYESIHKIGKFKPFENGSINEWGRMDKG
jgi:hypothetical protein